MYRVFCSFPNKAVILQGDTSMGEGTYGLYVVYLALFVGCCASAYFGYNFRLIGESDWYAWHVVVTFGTQILWLYLFYGEEKMLEILSKFSITFVIAAILGVAVHRFTRIRHKG